MIKKEIQDNIVIATLSDGKTNAVNIETLNQLNEVIKEVNSDPSIKGLVLTGEGRFFSSGFSLPMFLGFKNDEEVLSFFNNEEQVLLDFFVCEKPVVTAINGHCAAMGMILSMASDYRIIKNHPKIKMGMSEIKIGLSLSLAQTGVMRFGLDSDKKYRDIMYFGDMYDVTKAKELELVDEIVEEDNLINRAKEIITLWIDTPNRPFIQIKNMMKKETYNKIQTQLKEENWQGPLTATFSNQDVKNTLEFVQAAMDK